MNTDKIKEVLQNNRQNKTLLWNSFIVTIGATVGLFYKSIKYKGDFVDVFFIILGILIVITLLKMLQEENKEINKLIYKCDKEEKEVN